MNATPIEGFALAPYHIETFPIGTCVCNRNDFNCLSFPSKPGTKFTSFDAAVEICEAWNKLKPY